MHLDFCQPLKPCEGFYGHTLSLNLVGCTYEGHQKVETLLNNPTTEEKPNCSNWQIKHPT